MKKRMLAVFMIICLLYASACLAEEQKQADVTLESHMEADGMLYMTRMDDAYENGGPDVSGTPDKITGGVLPGIILLCGEGCMRISGEEEQYEANWRVAAAEPGRPFGEVLELAASEIMAPEGKMLAGWMVLDYATAAMEISETPVEKEGVLCFELFEDYYMVLHDYYACADMLTTEELAEYACESSDHAVVAVWMTADEYMTFVDEKSDAIKATIENDPLSQADLNLKSEELRTLWDAALYVVLGEAANVLPEEEWNALTEAQNAWMESTETAVEAAGKDWEGGSMYPLIVNMEAASLTEARVYEIYEMLK